LGELSGYPQTGKKEAMEISTFSTINVEKSDENGGYL